MDANTQTSTNGQNANGGTGVAQVQQPEPEVLLSPQQEDYITFLAVGGLLPSEDGAGVKVTAAQFAVRLGVARETLYYWRKHIPGLWEKVAARRREIGGKDRLSQAWNGIWLAACKGDARAGELYFRHFDPDYKAANAKAQDDSGNGFMDLLQRMRELNAQTNKQHAIDAQEAEVIPNDTHQSQPANITAGSGTTTPVV